MHETFKCEDCGHIFPDRKLARRNTQPGNYCPECADREKCAACGELVPNDRIAFKEDVKNYICVNCESDYQFTVYSIRFSVEYKNAGAP
jgi:DNA-directed RNA polymerase subunit RPC12/RpoP